MSNDLGVGAMNWCSAVQCRSGGTRNSPPQILYLDNAYNFPGQRKNADQKLLPPSFQYSLYRVE